MEGILMSQLLVVQNNCVEGKEKGCERWTEKNAITASQEGMGGCGRNVRGRGRFVRQCRAEEREGGNM